MSSFFTREEVRKHNDQSDIWIIINNQVYDITKFLQIHPGGKGILLQVAGLDCTEIFFSLHREDILKGMGQKFLIGDLKGEQPIHTLQPGDISQVPYSESSAWSNQFKSPYYRHSHFIFRKACRKIIDENITPFCQQWEENGNMPSQQLYQNLGSLGFWAARLGPGNHLKDYPSIGGINHEEFDYFHQLIITEEVMRIGCPGVADGSILAYSLPPVIKFCEPILRDKVVCEVLQGKKRICLSISDPLAGSDVANLSCIGKLSECGKYYIVNGSKKWITNGLFCDYFVTAVRTGGKGMSGISLMLIERSEGLKTIPIKTSYSIAAGTAYVIMENVYVPVQNLMGKLNNGFKAIAANFNSERWMISVAVNRSSRMIVEECFKWAHQRKVFNKQLIQQPVVRQKLAQMIAQIESVQNWIENITFQRNQMNHSQQVKYLAGSISLLKLQSTKVAYFVADQACQIFGGRAITRNGMGQFVERFQKSAKFGAIYGGSEEIMADLGIKRINFPNNARL